MWSTIEIDILVHVAISNILGLEALSMLWLLSSFIVVGKLDKTWINVLTCMLNWMGHLGELGWNRLNEGIHE